MEMSCPDKEFMNAKMKIICDRTKNVMQDAVEFAQELDLHDF
jgi:hypothetical protein